MKRICQKTRSVQRGFTILEAVVGAALLGFMAAAFSSALPAVFGMASRSDLAAGRVHMIRTIGRLVDCVATAQAIGDFCPNGQSVDLVGPGGILLARATGTGNYAQDFHSDKWFLRARCTSDAAGKPKSVRIKAVAIRKASASSQIVFERDMMTNQPLDETSPGSDLFFGMPFCEREIRGQEIEPLLYFARLRPMHIPAPSLENPALPIGEEMEAGRRLVNIPQNYFAPLSPPFPSRAVTCAPTGAVFNFSGMECSCSMAINRPANLFRMFGTMRSGQHIGNGSCAFNVYIIGE